MYSELSIGHSHVSSSITPSPQLLLWPKSVLGDIQCSPSDCLSSVLPGSHQPISTSALSLRINHPLTWVFTPLFHCTSWVNYLYLDRPEWIGPSIYLDQIKDETASGSWLYSTKNLALLCEDLVGREAGSRGRGYIIHIADLHCCTAEINTAL